MWTAFRASFETVCVEARVRAFVLVKVSFFRPLADDWYIGDRLIENALTFPFKDLHVYESGRGEWISRLVCPPPPILSPCAPCPSKQKHFVFFERFGPCVPPSHRDSHSNRRERARRRGVQLPQCAKLRSGPAGSGADPREHQNPCLAVVLLTCQGNCLHSDTKMEPHYSQFT